MILGIFQVDPSDIEATSATVPLKPPVVVSKRLAASSAVVAKRQAASAKPGRGGAGPVSIPLVPRAVAHLPTQRWRWSARRGMAQDHPFGRIARMEENLEQLIGTLEAEVDRLIAETGQLLSDEHSE